MTLTSLWEYLRWHLHISLCLTYSCTAAQYNLVFTPIWLLLPWGECFFYYSAQRRCAADFPTNLHVDRRTGLALPAPWGVGRPCCGGPSLAVADLTQSDLVNSTSSVFKWEDQGARWRTCAHSHFRPVALLTWKLVVFVHRLGDWDLLSFPA